MTREQQVAYWKRNLLYIVVLLTVWFGVSFVAGILIADQLDAFKVGGFPLGFWFANQGSLVIFERSGIEQSRYVGCSESK